jgi:sporulation integral membrane protein YtvI
LLEYTVGIILPFVIGFVIGVPIHLLSLKIHVRTKVPQKLCAVLLLIIFSILLSAIVFWGADRLISEVEDLVVWAQSDSVDIGERIASIIDSIKSFSLKIPFIEELEKIEGLNGIGDKIDAEISAGTERAISALASAIPAWSIKIAKSAPKTLISIVVLALCCFYFSTDYSSLKKSIASALPEPTKDKISKWLSVCAYALKKYLRAYLLIMLITFVEVFIGLVILRRSYAFLIAIAVAIVDILPIFGAGTILIPWAIVSFLFKDVGTGTGLLVLYGVITIVRQIIEPKIIGASLGVHPVITLFTMFSALSLFGVVGMLLSPFILIVLKELLSKARQ